MAHRHTHTHTWRVSKNSLSMSGSGSLSHSAWGTEKGGGARSRCARAGGARPRGRRGGRQGCVYVALSWVAQPSRTVRDIASVAALLMPRATASVSWPPPGLPVCCCGAGPTFYAPCHACMAQAVRQLPVQVRVRARYGCGLWLGRRSCWPHPAVHAWFHVPHGATTVVIATCTSPPPPPTTTTRPPPPSQPTCGSSLCMTRSAVVTPLGSRVWPPPDSRRRSSARHDSHTVRLLTGPAGTETVLPPSSLMPSNLRSGAALGGVVPGGALYLRTAAAVQRQGCA